MATKAATTRLNREYLNIQKNPPPYIVAHPSEANILEWHYILTGPPSTPYEGGQYWGTLIFPPGLSVRPTSNTDAHAFRSLPAQYTTLSIHQ